MTGNGGGWATRARWLIALSGLAVVAANVAGLWGIAVARRGAREEAARLFRLEVEGRARLIESTLQQTRTDLVFLAGSSAISRLEGLGSRRSGEGATREWHQLAAEAIVVFLRGHAEVAHLTVRSGRGHTLVRSSRRGGLPVLWGASEAQAAQGGGPLVEPSSNSGLLRAELGFDGSGPEVVRLIADVDADAFLSRALGDGSGNRCELADAGGRVFAHAPEPDPSLPPHPRAVEAKADIGVHGWSAPAPWTLTCAGPSAVEGPLAPVERRYRLTLALNVGAMGLAGALGWFAIQQTRRRERLEAQAQDELRIRELERQLFHAERLGTVGRLAAGMAHEINNPLEGMSNYLSLAREDLARTDVGAALRHLDGVRQGIERIAGLVRQVLAQADPASGASTLATPIDLGALATETLEFMRSRREFEGIVFSADIAPGSWVVAGNPVTLGQVLLNIVLNASEAQPDGGEIRVAVNGQDGRAVVEVADRGPGIASEDLVRIFEPFFSTKQSTGLGLSICHSIVRQHGGVLTAANRPGGGAVFRIDLPAT